MGSYGRMRKRRLHGAPANLWSSLGLDGTMRQTPEAEAQCEEETTGRSQDTEIGTRERQASALARVGRRRGGRVWSATTATRALLESGHNVAGASVAVIAA